MLSFGKCAVLSLDMGPVFCRCSGKGPFLLTAEMGGGEGERTEKDQEIFGSETSEQKCTADKEARHPSWVWLLTQLSHQTGR